MARKGKKYLLLVEDESIIAMAEKMELEGCGYAVKTVASGEKAVSAAEDPDLDLVLMDIDLGQGIAGTEAARRILEFRTLPIIFLSSHTEPEVVDKTEEISSYGYVVKDSGITVLNASIRMAFRLFDANQRADRHAEELARANEELQMTVEELRTANEELQDSQKTIVEEEQRFRDLFSNQPAGIAVFEPVQGGADFVFKDLNQAALEIEDIALENVVGRRLTEVFPGAAGEFGILEALRRVNRTGKPEILPAREYRDDRVAGWRQNRLFKLASGEVASSYVDMTRHVQMEQQLREEKRFVEVIAETSPVGITRLDGAGQIVFANRRAGEILGRTPEEICRLGFASGEWKIVDEAGEPLSADQLPFAAVRRTGEPVFDFRHRIQGAGGEERLLSINAAPVFTEEGEFDGMVSALDDITGEKAEEERRERLVQELASAQERLQALFDQAGDAIYITDMQGRFIQANREAARMSGYSREELLTLGVEDLEAEVNTPEKVAEFIRSLRGQPPALVPSRHRRKDGTVFPVELTMAVAELPGGPEVVAYVRDVSERKRNEAALQRAAEEREELLRELQHRAKNSFSMISSMVQLLRRSRKNPETREVLEELQGRITAFSELYDLLYQTREVEQVSLDTYLDRVLRSMGQQAPAVQVTRDLEELSLSARRAVFLGLITSELVNNALKHAYGEDGEGTLGVFLRKEGEQGVLSVVDDGAGSGPASEPDFGAGSSGMGLSLVRSLAESLEGAFSIDKGERTACRVVFPLQEPEA